MTALHPRSVTGMFKNGVPEGLAKVETVDGAILIAR